MRKKNIRAKLNSVMLSMTVGKYTNFSCRKVLKMLYSSAFEFLTSRKHFNFKLFFKTFFHSLLINFITIKKRI